METLLVWGISILVIFFYGKIIYSFYQNDKMKESNLTICLGYIFIAIILFIFPCLSFLGRIGKCLATSKYYVGIILGNGMINSSYILTVWSVLLAFSLAFLFLVMVVVVLLGDFVKRR